MMATIVIISAKYLSSHNIFHSDTMAELPKYIGINNDFIDLVGNFLSYLLVLQYCSAAKNTVAFDYVSEVLATWLSRTSTYCLKLMF